MKPRRTTSYRLTVLFLALSLFLCDSSNILAIQKSDNKPGPVSDSILQQQRDSMLFQLNLLYLNGVNDQGSPYELISIIEEILELDPSLNNPSLTKPGSPVGM